MSQVIGRLHAILDLDAAAFQRGLDGATRDLRKVGESMQRIGKDLSVKVTAPIAAFGALSLRTAGDFEAAMNRVRAATGATSSEMDALEDIARKMGETTQFRASQAAEAIEMLAKNGLSASQILGGALEASMLLAASSGSDLAASGDLATDVMLQFGKRASEMTGLVDGMTGVMLASKFGFDDYRLAVAQAGGVAGGLGVSFEDFNAALAGTSSLFASGSDAGTSFKTFLQRLVPASGPAADAMRELNLKFFEADGSMKTMAEVAQELRDGLAGLSDEARNEALSRIFGTDAMRTAIGLAEQGADGIERLKKTIGEASATEQAEARMKGFNGEMLKLASAVEALKIAIGQSGLLEWATDLVKALTEWVLRLKDVSPEMLKWGTIIAGVAAAIGPLLIGLGILLKSAAFIIGTIKVLGLGFAALNAPIIAAAVAIGVAAGGIIANWDKVGPWFSDLFDSLGQQFTGLAEILSGIVTGDMALTVQGFKDLWGGLQEFWSLMWDGIAGVITWTWETLIKPVTDKLGMTEGIVAGWERARDGIEAVLNAIAGAFDAAWSRIEPVISLLQSGMDRLNGSRDGPISTGPYTGDATGPIVPPIGAAMEQGLAKGSAGIKVQGAMEQGRAYGEAISQGLRLPELHGEAGVRVRRAELVLAGVSEAVEQAVRIYDTFNAPVLIHLAEFDGDKNALSAPERVFRGRIEKSPITTAAFGEGCDLRMELVSDAWRLTTYASLSYAAWEAVQALSGGLLAWDAALDWTAATMGALIAAGLYAGRLRLARAGAFALALIGLAGAIRRRK